jgi:hypothetical protein
MLRSTSVALLAAAALIGLGGASAASAMSLVAGGYGVDVEPYAPPASLSMKQHDFTSSAATAGLTFDFTPRNSGSLFSSGPIEPTTTMSLSLGVEQGYDDRLRLDTIGLGGRTPSGTGDSLEGLAIGGAFTLNDWQLTGSVGRASLLGQEADVFAAGVGYGRVNARLVYGTLPPTATGATGDVLMLSTDLAAWSWLTLEGDVAVSDTLASEPLTVGRIGLRLNF